MQIITERLAKVRKIITASGLDALIVAAHENRRYLSGFSAEDHQFDEIAAVLLIAAEHQMLITDSRFELQALTEAPDWEVIIYQNSMAKQLSSLFGQFKLRRIGFESERITIQQLREWEDETTQIDKQTKLEPLVGIGNNLRTIKSQHEIDLTYKALRLAETVFRQVIKKIKPGVTEKHIAWQMEKGMREAGADALSFPIIVAAGPNSALPHATPSDRRIENGEPILVDWGCKLSGYCSDTTRTIVIGTPDETFLKVYHCVLEAQKRAINLIRAGSNSKMVDAAARDFIHDSGFKGRFGHGLGHGTGLAVHEAPRLSPHRESELETGMIVTVEPGIYLPDWGGVRIEHQVVVRPDGAEVMNELSPNFDVNMI